MYATAFTPFPRHRRRLRTLLYLSQPVISIPSSCRSAMSLSLYLTFLDVPVLALLIYHIGKLAPEPRFPFLITYVFREKGLTTRCSFRKRPQALQRGWPSVRSSCRIYLYQFGQHHHLRDQQQTHVLRHPERTAWKAQRRSKLKASGVKKIMAV